MRGVHEHRNRPDRRHECLQDQLVVRLEVEKQIQLVQLVQLVQW